MVTPGTFDVLVAEDLEEHPRDGKDEHDVGISVPTICAAN
jgi:hypothetical protein